MDRRLKRYEGNYDGRRRGLVVASNQREAAQIVGCGVRSFRSFWGERRSVVGGWVPRPRILYTKPFDSDLPWVEGRCDLGRAPGEATAK